MNDLLSRNSSLPCLDTFRRSKKDAELLAAVFALKIAKLAGIWSNYIMKNIYAHTPMTQACSRCASTASPSLWSAALKTMTQAAPLTPCWTNCAEPLRKFQTCPGYKKINFFLNFSFFKPVFFAPQVLCKKSVHGAKEAETLANNEAGRGWIIQIEDRRRKVC